METPRIRKGYLRIVCIVLTLFLITGPFSSDAFATRHDSLLNQPSTAIAAPPVLLQVGTAGTSTIYANNTSAMTNTPSPSQTLYAHQETTTIAGSTFNLLKLSSADASGTTIQVDAGSTGRILFAKFVYSLAGVGSIPSSTWTFYYRAWRGSSVTAHCDVDISILIANGTTRQTMATAVASSANLPGSSPPTSSGTYSWSAYNVIDQTDFLEIDYYANVTQAKSGRYVFLRIDDSTLALVDQTSSVNVYLPLTYDYVLQANNTSTNSWQIRLNRYSDSGISRLQNCTIYFHNSTGGNTKQIEVDNGAYISQTGSWCGLGSSTTTYIAMTVQTSSTGNSFINAYLEIWLPATTTYIQYIISFAVS